VLELDEEWSLIELRHWRKPLRRALPSIEGLRYNEAPMNLSGSVKFETMVDIVVAGK